MTGVCPLGTKLRPYIRQPPADPFRKVRFRETAREIVAKDRYNRKYGYAIDTAGAIASAMERAYRQGFADAQSEAPSSPQTVFETTGGAIEWALIPPRPRTAFWSICLFALGREGRPENGAQLLPAMTKRDTRAWRLVIPDRPDWNKQIGEKTIVSLVRLGLLEKVDGKAQHFRLSVCGKATWQRFVKRGGQFSEDLTDI
jgi:hypothetical protein